jgi:DNA-directed RNA polymerase sigma subunit (sigma70/sigma32)
MDHAADLNCSLVAIKRHGAMTLHEVGAKLNLSYVRIKQIQDAAIEKIDREEMRDELFVLPDGFF